MIVVSWYAEDESGALAVSGPYTNTDWARAAILSDIQSAVGNTETPPAGITWEDGPSGLTCEWDGTLYARIHTMTAPS